MVAYLAISAISEKKIVIILLKILRHNNPTKSKSNQNVSLLQKSSPTQYFWYRTTLQISEDINYPETFNYKIALALVIAWILVYLCMIKGIASSGKVVYVTATFPYIVLVIFFFRGITLKGMSDGLIHLFTPKWHTILDPVVWLEAGTQIFFSLGLAFGGLIAFSSYNPVDNNCYRDAIMVSMTNCLTSMFAGIVVFSIIGFKATMIYEKCLEIRNETLLEMFGSSYKSMVFPEAGESVTIDKNGTITNLLMPLLPVCDLQKELDNVSTIYSLHLRQIHDYIYVICKHEYLVGLYVESSTFNFIEASKRAPMENI